ncbi:MAG: thiamine phosphate synthase [bacterium]|nr:thiamine phosphate synthase [bacterium]
MYLDSPKNERSFLGLSGHQLHQALIDALRRGLLYGITDLRFGHGSHLEAAQALVEAGICLVQYRGKDTPRARQLEELLELVPWAAERGAAVVVNDDAAMARAVGAAGLHLGQGDRPPLEARDLVGPHVLLGLSTHNRQQALSALGQPVDYLGVGPAYATQTKPQEPEAGLGFLAWASQEITLPQVAIGGITEERLGEVLKTGQKSPALITALLGAPDLRASVARISARLADC